MTHRWSAHALGCAVLGGAVWLALLALRPPSPSSADWVVSLLLLAPLALMPLGLRLVEPPDLASAAGRCWRMVIALQLPTALALAAAFLLPQSVAAAGLALPWLATTGVMALLALLRVLRRGWLPLPELAIDAGLAFPLVGAVWAFLDRADIHSLQFATVVVLLTAVHFHYAGFALPLLTGLAGRSRQGALANLAALGVIVGVPLVAAGITASQLGSGPLLETVAATITALAGLLTAWLHLRLAFDSSWPTGARLLWAVAGLALAFGMMLAGLYGSRSWFPVGWLDYPRMWAFHGTANSLGFALCGLMAQTLARSTTDSSAP